MPLEAGASPSRRRIRLRRLAAIALLPALAAAGFGVAQVADTDADSAPAADPPATANAPAQPAPKPAVQPPAHPKTRPGSDPSVLPGNVLVADKANSRLLEIDPYGRVVWRFPRPGDLAPGQTFQVPDDAFYTPNGRSIVATQEDDFAISAVDIAHHRISYRYGVPGVPGSSADHLYNPDDALDASGRADPHRGHQELQVAGSPASLPLPGPADRRDGGLHPRPPALLRLPEWRLSRLERRHDRDRDHWRLGGRPVAVGPAAPRGPCPRLHVPVGHEPAAARSLPERRLHLPGSDRDLQHQGPPSVEVRARRARMRSTIHRWRSRCRTATSSPTTTTTTA